MRKQVDRAYSRGYEIHANSHVSLPSVCFAQLGLAQGPPHERAHLLLQLPRLHIGPLLPVPVALREGLREQRLRGHTASIRQQLAASVSLTAGSHHSVIVRASSVCEYSAWQLFPSALSFLGTCDRHLRQGTHSRSQDAWQAARLGALWERLSEAARAPASCWCSRCGSRCGSRAPGRRC